MIAQEQIIKMANQYQTTEVNVLREYYQHLFLAYFYQQPQTNNIYFKGGTAMRLVHKSPRFSQDLDFSANTSKEDIEQALILTLTEMEKEGILSDLQEAKTTTGGYLATIVFQKDPGVAIRIEISLRRNDNSGELATIINDYIPSYTILVLAQDQLIGQKIEALQARKKARDFYDLYFILRKQLPIRDKKALFPEVLSILRSSDINFEAELKEFLPRSHWIIIKDFKETLKRELKRYN